MSAAYQRKTEPALSRQTVDRLLSLLDPDPVAAIRKYESIKSKLTNLFRWRGCPSPEEYAAKTIDVAAAELFQGARLQIQNPYLYFHSVAIDVSNALMDHWRQTSSYALTYGEARARGAAAEAPEFSQPHPPEPERRRLVECIRESLNGLPLEDVGLITRYHQPGDSGGKHDRKGLALQFGVSQGTLRTRAFRIRTSIQRSVAASLRGPDSIVPENKDLLPAIPGIDIDRVESGIDLRPEGEELVTMYLLGELAEPDQARLEEIVFAEDEDYEQLVIAEDELRYDYALGLLDRPRRERFERRFAVSPVDRTRLEFASALVSALSAPAPPPPKLTFKLTEAPMSLFETWQSRLRARHPLQRIGVLLARSAHWAAGHARVRRERRQPSRRLKPAIDPTPAIDLPTLGAIAESTQTASRREGRWDRVARLAFAGVGVILIAGVVVVITQTLFYQNQVRALKRQLNSHRVSWSQIEEERTRVKELQQELEVERSRRMMFEDESTRRNRQISPPPTPEASPASFILSAGFKQQLQPGDAERVRLQLNVKKSGDYPSYKALLKTAEGKVVWSQSGLRPGRLGSIQVVAVTLLARLVPAGDYHIELQGLPGGGSPAEQVDDYFFSVARR